MLRLADLNFETPAVMGVVNVTPDSFSDGGRYADRDEAFAHAEAIAATGAAIIDIGGESTRPGAQPISVQQELDRVIPVVEAVRKAVDVPISIDTSKPEVMRAAVAAGASMINDIRALTEDGALAAAVELARPVCLMHMRGQPGTMQKDPVYEDVVREVGDYLAARVAACRAAGLSEELLLIDPGFGFGKRAVHNIELLRNLRELRRVGRPIVAGLSRKTTLGELTGQPVGSRLAASVAAAVIAALNGASIVRVHDVRETVDAMRIVRAVREGI